MAKKPERKTTLTYKGMSMDLLRKVFGKQKSEGELKDLYDNYSQFVEDNCSDIIEYVIDWNARLATREP